MSTSTVFCHEMRLNVRARQCQFQVWVKEGDDASMSLCILPCSSFYFNDRKKQGRSLIKKSGDFRFRRHFPIHRGLHVCIVSVCLCIFRLLRERNHFGGEQGSPPHKYAHRKEWHSLVKTNWMIYYYGSIPLLRTIPTAAASTTRCLLTNNTNQLTNYCRQSAIPATFPCR